MRPESLSLAEVLQEIGDMMEARIDDGYTRYVGIGDHVRVPGVDFVYRPLRGAEINEHIWKLAKSKDNAADVQYEELAERVLSWEASGFDSPRPSVDDLKHLDAFAFRAMYDVIFNNSPPERVFDRQGEPKGDVDQGKLDAKN